MVTTIKLLSLFQLGFVSQEGKGVELSQDFGIKLHNLQIKFINNWLALYF